MSVAADTNLLVYASDASSPMHEKASATLDAAAGGSELLYVFWPVAMAYLRIATHPSIFNNPLSPDVAEANLASLLSRPNVRSPGEQPGFWRSYATVTEDTVVRGDLVPDAHLVALMHESGVRRILSHDRDFQKFDGIKVVDPLG